MTMAVFNLWVWLAALILWSMIFAVFAAVVY